MGNGLGLQVGFNSSRTKVWLSVCRFEFSVCPRVWNPGEYQQLEVDVGAFGFEANLFECLIWVARFECVQFGLELRVQFI